MKKSLILLFLLSFLSDTFPLMEAVSPISVVIWKSNPKYVFAERPPWEEALLTTLKQPEQLFNLLPYYDFYQMMPYRYPCRAPLANNMISHISSGFGVRYHPISYDAKHHRGMDFAVPIGTPVLATGAGEVLAIASSQGFGHYIELQHDYGFVSRYAHLDRTTVFQGQHIEIGQLIGYSGASGKLTGPHLHYEVWQGDNVFNPAVFCNLRYELESYK